MKHCEDKLKRAQLEIDRLHSELHDIAITNCACLVEVQEWARDAIVDYHDATGAYIEGRFL